MVEAGQDRAVEFRILGTVEVRIGGAPVPLNSKQRSLLAMLLLSANRPVRAERLPGALWEPPLPHAVDVRVRTLVSELRRACAAAGPQLIVTGSRGYLLRVGPGQLDLDTFVHRVDEARQASAAGRVAVAAGLYEDALASWSGAALGGTNGPFLLTEAVRLEELRRGVVEEHAEAMLAAGRHRELVAELRAVVADHPNRERPHAQLMVALYRCGRRSESLEVYRSLRTALIEESGLEPTPELQRLHQQVLMADPALEWRAPAPARPSPVGPSRQLPAESGQLVGRRAQLESLDQLAAAGTRLVLVVGPAGVGKTALVVHWAHRSAGRFPDGQLFLDLRGFDPAAPMMPGDALPLLLRALGVPAGDIPLSVDEQVLLYRSVAADRRMLLVLDNAAEADQVRPLLPGSPDCLVVLTSRDRLSGLVALDGARRLALDVLSPHDAVDMLTGTAGTDRRDRDADAAAELARLCGYLPLALRIAGARLADQPDHSMRRHADELLAHGRLAGLRLDGDQRASVRAAFDLSYRTLPALARRMFRLLGLVPAPEGLSLAGASALAAVHAEQAERLRDTLARVHLVTGRGDRFACHDLLRDYATELGGQDPAGEREAAIGRLMAYYLHTVDNAAASVFAATGRLPRPPLPPGVRPTTFAGVTEARTWLSEEWDNLMAAFGYAAAHGPDPMVWHLADGLRPIMRLGGSMAELNTVAETGLVAAQRAGDPAGEGAMWHLVGQVSWLRSEFRATVEAGERALALHRRANWRPGEAMTLRALGGALHYLGQSRAAADRLIESLAIDREIGDRTSEAITLGNLAAQFYECGDLAEAIRYHELAWPLLVETGHRHGQAIALSNLGLLRHAQGSLDEALAVAERSLAVAREVGSHHQETTSAMIIGTVHCDAGRYDEALASYTAGLELAGRIGDARLEGFGINGLARVDLRRGRVNEAVTRLEGALAGFDGSNHQRGPVEGMFVLSTGYAGQRRYREAYACAERMLALSERYPYRIQIAQAHHALAAACLGLGDLDRALIHAQRALRAQRRSGQRLEAARTLVTLGQIQQHRGSSRAARSYWQRAQAMFDEIGSAEAKDGVLPPPSQLA
jgi:DNA-binding SARP family transcriptional activator/tetratricopeptide (TPR) repeat protein